MSLLFQTSLISQVSNFSQIVLYICNTLYYTTLYTVMLGASEVVLVVKNMPANAGDKRDAGSIPRLGRSPEEGPLVFLSPESHGQRSLAGYGPQVCKESDITEASQHAHMQYR